MLSDTGYQGSRREYAKRQRKQLIIFIVAALILAIVAFVIGFYARLKSGCDGSTEKGGNIENEKLHKSMVAALVSSNIEKDLKYFAEKPHLASRKRNTELIHEIHRRFVSYGFNATYHPYKVLLAFPKSKKRNKVSIIDEKGNASYTSKGIEDFLEQSEEIAKDYPSFNGYAPNGTAEGELVYANYGRLEDFVKLEEYGVNVSGKIVIARYGKIFRGSKVLLAQQRGAIGVILYSDPFDAAPEGEKFIKGRWLPDDGIQRGSILNINGGGDPLTLGYPSKDWAYHADLNIAELPKIPAQPVSAQDAFHLMKHMGGPKADKGWVGLLNISYNIGPYMDNKTKVKLEVFNYRELRTITNVCGTVPGKIEPDRYVILGNHVDAWVFGGVDPSSGTSVMMEIARVVGDKLKTGWRPRRTIKFCGWDGEEYGLIGSSEFVEEYRSQLRDRAVAYINVDSAVSGNESLRCASSPLLKKMMIEVHKEVGDPFDKGMTVFDRSKLTQPDKNYPDEHRIGSLGSGSDYTAFYQFLGVPSLDVGYQQVKTNKRLKISSYPVYHSLHDTYYWVKHFVDKDFTVHLTVARVVMSYLLRLADSLVLPFEVQRYAARLNRDAMEFQAKLKKEAKRKDIEELAERLMSAARNFTTAYKEFAEQKNAADLSDPLQLRMWNDRLIQLEKGFIYVDGLPGRSSLKHYIMAPSKYNAYGSTTFPAISDALYEAKDTGDWDQVKKQISITAYLIQNVADTLKSVT